MRDANGVYHILTGNRTGALLCEYILESMKEHNTLPKNGVIIKTIVTTELAVGYRPASFVRILRLPRRAASLQSSQLQKSAQVYLLRRRSPKMLAILS